MKSTHIWENFPAKTKDSAGAASDPSPCSAINIVFDGPPGPEAGRFVEVETDDGKSINAGEWIKRPDGLWALRIVPAKCCLFFADHARNRVVVLDRLLSHPASLSPCRSNFPRHVVKPVQVVGVSCKFKP